MTRRVFPLLHPTPPPPPLTLTLFTIQLILGTFKWSHYWLTVCPQWRKPCMSNPHYHYQDEMAGLEEPVMHTDMDDVSGPLISASLNGINQTAYERKHWPRTWRMWRSRGRIAYDYTDNARESGRASEWEILIGSDAPVRCVQRSGDTSYHDWTPVTIARCYCRLLLFVIVVGD